ncbi:SAM-dependent methyltransferase [Halobacteriovorax marinus]|uniref:SAM-dependent methyltransferase n=1 Tax=Halobacteriovorax marinus TaxID=97084 RepID=A0A1Y5FHI5_9BACT|nr:SAM-dependent methyltransferase [Halobacteriovorax marinus]
MECRNCKNTLKHKFADLESSPPSNSFISEEGLNEVEHYYPLKIFVCEKCFLVQVDEYKKTETIFDDSYAYFSSFSKSWLEHAKKYSYEIKDYLDLNSESMVIEVASNDGYLLKNFKDMGIPCLGVEPTKNTAKVSMQKGIETICEFFGEELGKYLVNQNKQADLIIGNNVLAHVPDIHDFVQGFTETLKPEGIVTLEFPYLVNLIKLNQFDTIYHEHFSYLSITAIKDVFGKHDLEIFKIDELDTHGGSLRVYVKRVESKRAITPSVGKILDLEKEVGIDKIEFYENFQEKCDTIKLELLEFLISKKKEGAKVAAYGAAAKGNTLLNYCGVKKDLLSFVVDASPYKQGKYLPGSRIPVVNMDVLLKEKPDYIIILPWNLKTEITALLKEKCDWNYKLVVPIPALEIFEE